jgi:hypothetical protein
MLRDSEERVWVFDRVPQLRLAFANARAHLALDRELVDALAALPRKGRRDAER